MLDLKPRFGGLFLMRLPTESITIQYPGSEVEITLLRIIDKEAHLYIERRIDGQTMIERMEMKMHQEIALPCGVMLSIEDCHSNRMKFRVVADSSIRVLRTELLKPKFRKRRRVSENQDSTTS